MWDVISVIGRIEIGSTALRQGEEIEDGYESIGNRRVVSGSQWLGGKLNERVSNKEVKSTKKT